MDDDPNDPLEFKTEIEAMEYLNKKCNHEMKFIAVYNNENNKGRDWDIFQVDSKNKNKYLRGNCSSNLGLPSE